MRDSRAAAFVHVACVEVLLLHSPQLYREAADQEDTAFKIHCDKYLSLVSILGLCRVCRAKVKLTGTGKVPTKGPSQLVTTPQVPKNHFHDVRLFYHSRIVESYRQDALPTFRILHPRLRTSFSGLNQETLVSIHDPSVCRQAWNNFRIWLTLYATV